MTVREERALEIADKFRIVNDGPKWIVPSQSGSGKYTVRIVGQSADCTCPDHELRRKDCKHILAVRYVIERRDNPDGTTTVTESVTVTKQTTYPQDWPAYNAAQTNESDLFQYMLSGIVEDVATPTQKGKGQRRIPLADAIFAATFKVYSTVSGRRFMSDLRDSHARGFITKVPHYNSIFNYLESEELTPILHRLIEKSATPLSTVETDFAADSTGFSTCRFERWFDHKHGKLKFTQDYIKVHVITGVKTNIITACEIRGKETQDTSMLKPMMESTQRHFQISEVSADKGYLSYNNARRIADAGGTPFIAFKDNSGPGDMRKEGVAKTKAWREMYHYFMYRREDFVEHYNKRNNVESTFSMLKRKFGDSIRSKTDIAMKNEALCKVLCHNLVVLIHEMFELGIDPLFLPNGMAAAQRERLI